MKTYSFVLLEPFIYIFLLSVVTFMNFFLIQQAKKAQMPDGYFPEYQTFARRPDPSSNKRDICFYSQANRRGLIAVPSDAPHKYVLCEYKAK